MSEWDQDYQDEVQEIDKLLYNLYISWEALYWDFTEPKPFSLEEFREKLEETVEAFLYLETELESES